MNISKTIVPYCFQSRVRNLGKTIPPIEFTNFAKCNISVKIDIKRGCTEFDFSFPGYKDVKKINEIVYDKNWKKKEKLIDIEIAEGSQKGKKVFSKSLSDITLGEVLIINNWLTYAKIIGDESYKEISEEFLYSDYISIIANKFKNKFN